MLFYFLKQTIKGLHSNNQLDSGEFVSTPPHDCQLIQQHDQWHTSRHLAVMKPKLLQNKNIWNMLQNENSNSGSLQPQHQIYDSPSARADFAFMCSPRIMICFLSKSRNIICTYHVYPELTVCWCPASKTATLATSPIWKTLPRLSMAPDTGCSRAMPLAPSSKHHFYRL